MSSGNWLEYFGSELRLHRERAGLTQAEVADRVGYGNGLISKIERAERIPQPPLCTTLDGLFGTAGLFERLGEQVRANSSLASGFAAYLDLEPQAVAIHSYASHMVPGLLQTEEYARAAIAAERPRLSQGEIDSRLAVRMTRQDHLVQRAPRLWAILDEAALHRRVGSPDVMKVQFERLVEGRQHETVQVFPYAAGISPSMGDTFLIAEFPEGPDAAHVDTSAGVSLPQDEETAARYRTIFDHLRASSLSEEQSRTLIETRVEELNGR